MNRSWIKIPFLYLLIVAVLGVFLRMMFIYPVEGINFKNFLHAHSHIALLGWLYSAFFIGLLVAFIKKEDSDKRPFKLQFWLSQFSVVGMLISFPIQGYGAVSITFSTMHILLSYWFIYSFLKYARNNELLRKEHKVSFAFVKWSLIFMAISSLGPWALGPIMVIGKGGSDLYYLAIYFYLHFQYNGWFTFAVFALFFWWLEKNKVSYSKKESQRFFILMTASCVPAYALSVVWTQPSAWVYWVGGIAASVQLLGLYSLFKLLWQIRSDLKRLIGGIASFVMTIVLISLAIKLALQFLSAFPLFADLAYKIRNFVIGYLHLTLIGFVSLFVFVFFHLTRLIDLSMFRNKMGLALFIAGFILSEVLIFLQGIMFWGLWGSVPYYYELLFEVSILMPAGLVIFALNRDR